MTAIAFREILSDLSLSQLGAAKLLGVNARTVRRWALGEQDIPRAVIILLRLMVVKGVSPDEAERLSIDGGPGTADNSKREAVRHLGKA